MTPEQMKSLILYEDDDIIVLNKPASLLVHPVAKDSVALTQFLPPGVELAHRLDRETSGCLVLGKNPAALRRLGQWFKTGQIRKTYHALVSGKLEGSGVIDAPLIKENALMVVREDGQRSVTEWRALEQRDGSTLVELHPLTGRTHQLRAHMRHLGHPIVGDVKYDGPPAERMMLHASALNLPGLQRIEAKLPF